MSLKKPEVFETATGSYKTVDAIGEGGSGIVYRVISEDGEDFAIKCLKPDRVNRRRLGRFKNELNFCLKNNHPNIMTVLDHGLLINQGKIPFFVMNYYSTTLRDVMKSDINEDDIDNIISQILDGIEAAHLTGTWHRDIKPENILYDPGRNLYVISDFGIAHFSQEELLTAVETKSSERLANFKYAAPEQRVRDQEIDGRADIYAIGLIINELFTNHLALGTKFKSIKNVNPDYSFLDEIVEEMLRNDPAERISSIDEVKKRLISLQMEFVTRQRLSKLKNSVIPKYGIDDPLILNPIELERIDYRGEKVLLFLNKAPNDKWIRTFKSITNYQYTLGISPPNFNFEQELAYITLPESEVQKMVDYFKDYVVTANNQYANTIREENIEKERVEQKRLQKEREEEERRLRIIRNTKI